MDVKKIVYIISTVVVIIATSYFTGVVLTRRSNNIYTELEGRFSAVETTNRQLKAENNRLITNNNRIRDIQQSNDDLIQRGREIIKDIELEYSGTTETIDRIERNLETLERFIILFTEEKP